MTDEATDNETDDEQERDVTYRGAGAVNNDDWDQMEADNEEVIDRRRVDEMTSALDIVETASELDKIRYRSEVCDEQREQIDDAVEAALSAADAVWPADEGVPHLRDDD